MATIKEKLALLPEQPGCYLMKNTHEQIIYVGKAKNLRSRVRSYFSGSHDAKTQRLVSDIADFEYIIVSSEIESLILEMNLIKKHDPKYNVMLKDDKSYPYIKITSERHPKLIISRKIKKNSGKYFGPYPNATAATETKRLLDRLYPLRKCRTMPDRVCLYYHIGQCLAPCVKEVSIAEYKEMTEGITKFLNGGYQDIKKNLDAKMHAASEQLNFEHAKELRDQIRHIETVMEKQTVMFQDLHDRDVFGYSYDKGWMCVQVFFMRQGKLIERDVSIFPFYQEPEEDFLTFVGKFYLHHNHLKPREVLIPHNIDEALLSEVLEVEVHQPQRGKKRELVQTATKNAQAALQEKFSLIERDENRTIKAIEKLGEHLHIAPPRTIETFDNSNIQGVHPVSAMVVFEDGKPFKKGYRKFHIKTVKGPDDYATMKEVIRRRYSRLLKEKKALPDLILIDGGKGQMSAAIDVLENELGLDIPVCGLIKDDKHQTSQLVKGEPPMLIPMERNSQEFYLLQRIQDEVHRFAISFHRNIRDKSMIRSALDDIPGVGSKRRQMLLKHFGSVKKIKEASVLSIKESGVPYTLAEIIHSHFHSEKEEPEKES